MPMPKGAVTRLTSYFAALAAAVLLIAVPGTATADDVASAPEPNATATESTPSAQADSRGVPSDVSVPGAPALPEPASILTPPGMAQKSHFGGM